MLEIAAMSDLHGYLPKIKPCDLVLIGGDIFPETICDNVEKSVEWFYRNLCQYFLSRKCSKIILIGGEKDKALESAYEEISKTIDTFLKDKLIYLNNQPYPFTKEDKLYIIWGSPNTRSSTFQGAFTVDDKTLKTIYSYIPDHCDILLTHDSPSLCGMGMDGKENLGSKLLDEIIKEKSPKYVFCGGIHSGDHTVQTWGKTKIVNVALANKLMEQWYEPLYITIE